ncbi:MAG: Eco57I restriction-modification methylase domain-containing protein [Coriobacteriia bacterium]
MGFLLGGAAQYEYVIGNPPYVSITGLSEDEKSQYRALFTTARGRFDLCVLFFERALNSLAPRGRLVFITPEKFAYVESTSPLRRVLLPRNPGAR